MTSFVTAQYGSDKGQVLDPNSKGTPVVATTDLTGRVKLSAGGAQISTGGGANPPNTAYTLGDSLAANGWQPGAGTMSLSPEGAFNWFQWILGNPFTYLGNSAVGGTTAADIIPSQFPAMLAVHAVTPIGYAWITAGYNDIFNPPVVTGAVAAANKIAVIEELIAVGITPIWSTIWASQNNGVTLPEMLICNDILRRYAASNPCGLFYDGYEISADPLPTTGTARLPWATYYYDPTHVNNWGAFKIAQYAAAKIGSLIPKPNTFLSGLEDRTNIGTPYNQLTNTSFAGTSGTKGASGVAGTVPTSWDLTWLVRTSADSVATAAIVDVLDPATGLSISKGVQITITGTVVAGDELQLTQKSTAVAGIKTGLGLGDYIQSEGVVKLDNAANLSRVWLYAKCDSNISACGLNISGAATSNAVALVGNLPALHFRSVPVQAAGVASTVMYVADFLFNGAGTGTVITLYKPRYRKVV